MNNFFSPYGQFPMYPTPQYPQPTPLGAPQTQTQATQLNTNKIFVSGVDEVNMRMLQPNSDFIFLDNDKSILYQKKVDASGHFEVKVFDITPHTEIPTAQVGYVSKEEFDRTIDELKKMINKGDGA